MDRKEHQRRRNAAKQRRWKARHGERLQNQEFLRDPIRPGPESTHGVFELVYRDGPHAGLPCYVGVSVKAERQLPEAVEALLPNLVESSAWVPSGLVPGSDARRLALARVAQIRRWSGGHPAWLLNDDCVDCNGCSDLPRG